MVTAIAHDTVADVMKQTWAIIVNAVVASIGDSVLRHVYLAIVCLIAVEVSSSHAKNVSGLSWKSSMDMEVFERFLV